MFRSYKKGYPMKIKLVTAGLLMGALLLPVAGYAGSYKDAWYGPIDITQKDGKLRINFKQTPNMAGDLEHFQYDTFIARWDDRNAEPAYVSFALDATGAVSTSKMKAVSPLADFSWDFHDLLITPAKAE